MSKRIWEGHGEDPSLSDITDDILKRLKNSEIRERAEKDAKVIEQALAEEENKKQSKSLEQILSLKEKDAEKLLGIIRAIIKDVLIEERVATKITVFK